MRGKLHLLEARINEIIESLENINNNKIFVLKGFSNEQMNELSNSFFQNTDTFQISEKNIENFRQGILPQAIKSMSSDSPYFWMSYEQYIISYQILFANFDFYILTNNIYNTSFPYQDTIADIESAYQMFLNIDAQLSEEETKKFQQLTKFYGDITKSPNTENYYVTFNDEPNDTVPQFSFFEKSFVQIIPEEYDFSESETLLSVELSDDETVFLDLIQLILSEEIRDQVDKVQIVSMVPPQELPNRYLERSQILQYLSQDYLKIVFVEKQNSKRVIEAQEEYEAVLERYWGYHSFRDLEMYKDIRNENRELIEVSQAQIIDDIVSESISAMREESYKDVFITSATGSGKSIMFQLPAIYLREKFLEENPLTIVISPLIALMNDQVQGLKDKGIDIGRTINSNTPPHEREQILHDIEDGICSILYLSPETLQARYDIKALIGSRRLGLVIIDEAHIVTTWGKSFRADYWYLGIYLQKLRKEYQFPIVTFTATAIYGGTEDMYLETRDSLNMINPISYFGKVRRDDIKMYIKSSVDEKLHKSTMSDYVKLKSHLMLQHLKMAHKAGEKTLIYFATVKSLRMAKNYIELNAPEINEVTGVYHGQLDKVIKDEVLNNYRDGDLKVVLATKAFGMGVDIPDIKNVYHFTPSGSVTDYIQEIGRAARDAKKVPGGGRAFLDFLPKDFWEVQQLYGLSRIKATELLQVMQKVIDIYKLKDSNRNLIVNADDFKFIFSDDINDESQNLDNKVKTALLLIEKDFSSPDNIGFPPFAARPRSVFGKESIFVNEEILRKLNNSKIRNYIKLKAYLKNSGEYDNIYSLDLAGVWEDNYRKFSFPDFKRRIFTPEERVKLDGSDIFNVLVYATAIEIPAYSEAEINDILDKYQTLISVFADFAANKKRSDSYFTSEEAGQYLQKSARITDKLRAKGIAQAIINACFEYQNLTSKNFISERLTQRDSLYKFQNSYDAYIEYAQKTFRQFFINKNYYAEYDNKFYKYYFRGASTSQYYEKDRIVLGLAESMGLLSFTVENGNSPQIYMRINSIYPMEKAIKSKFYENRILSSIWKKHITSVKMLEYLFLYKPQGNNNSEKVVDYTNFFWENIENYFLGMIPEKVQVEISKAQRK